jgi:N-acyl-D-amino-acid deacylase
MYRSFPQLSTASAFLIATGLSLTSCATKSGEQVDILITDGLVYAGDLAEPSITDIGIVGDRIVFVGNARKARLDAVKIVDAKNKMVAPGFIDAHVHAEPELDSAEAKDRAVVRQIMQGVTTSVIGVDGEGRTDIADQLDAYEAAGIGQNIATYVGFGAIRRRIIGEDARAPTAEELKSMKSLAAKAMCDGAIGISSGLFYAPQSFAKTDEVIQIVSEAGKRGGLYDTHQRDEGDSTIGVVPSLKEAILIGRESGAPLHIAHIKVTGSSKTGGAAMAELVAMVEAARAAGQPVTADQYPWAAANTGLDAAVIPRWAQAGGRDAMLKRFNTPSEAERIKAESKVTMALAEHVLIDHAPGQPELIGKFLSEIASDWQLEPIEAAMRILDRGVASAAVFVMTEADIRIAMRQPWVMTSSDGRSGGHPRAYASFPKLWTDYVNNQQVISAVEFVHRSSGLTADTLGLNERGYIRKGYFADIVIIDPTQYAPKATFMEPTLLSTGVVDLMINGELELEAGKLTGALAGRSLRHTSPANTCD